MVAPGQKSAIDAVDEYNHPVDTVLRRDALRTAANFRTMHVLVFNHHGELLLQRLSATRERSALKWGSSVAGYLHAGETYDHAAQRRLREELGLSVRPTEVGVLRMRDQQSLKFVGVYTAIAENVSNKLPGHIAQLEWRNVDQVIADIEHSPDLYTETFRSVLDYWWQHRAEDHH